MIRRGKLPYPHPGQIAVRRGRERFSWLAAGRRWRKTTLGMSLTVEAALEGEEILWGAPTVKQTLIGWNEFVRAVGNVASFHITDREIHFPGGGKVFFRTLDDPNNARGYTADGAVLDEAGYIKKVAYYEIIRPMLIDTEGWFLGMGTPNGRNWFWLEHKRDGATAWQIPTLGCEIKNGQLIRKPHSYENPDIPWGEIVDYFEKSPEKTFRQEILAEFLEGEGTVFRNINANMTATPSRPQEHKGHRTCMGVDWGKQNDFTAISIFCAECGKEVQIDRFNKIDYIFQRDRIAALADRWKPSQILCEENAMAANMEMLRKDIGRPVRGFRMTSANKPGLISRLGVALEKEEYKWISDPKWTAELEAFEQNVNRKTGHSTYAAPEGLNDDTVIARALALRAAITGTITVA